MKPMTKKLLSMIQKSNMKLIKGKIILLALLKIRKTFFLNQELMESMIPIEPCNRAKEKTQWLKKFKGISKQLIALLLELLI